MTVVRENPVLPVGTPTLLNIRCGCVTYDANIRCGSVTYDANIRCGSVTYGTRSMVNRNYYRIKRQEVKKRNNKMGRR
jgi:hypothetical protein